MTIIPRAILALLLVSTVPAVAKDRAPPPQPATEPDWAIARQQSETAIKSRLFDPSSAQITWLQGFRWGSWKPFLQGRKWGWVACGTVNAKNRLGGYVGSVGFGIVYDGRVTFVDIGDSELDTVLGECQQLGGPSPQSELRDAPAVQQGAAGSVADELEKLASLRDRAIITDAEFQAQKAKLLGN